MKIILLSEDQALSDRIESILSSHYFIVDSVQSPELLTHFLSLFPYDLIIVDTTLLTLDIVSFSNHLQAVEHPLMLLLLFHEVTSDVEILSLNLGADDCLRRFCDDDVLIAHVRALMRRKGRKSPIVMRWGDLSVDCSRQQVHYGRVLIALTPKEYQLLSIFLRSPHQTFSAQSLIDLAWSSTLDQPNLETIKTHIRSLRHKLKQAGIEDLVKTVYGFGYRLNPELLASIAMA